MSGRRETHVLIGDQSTTIQRGNNIVQVNNVATGQGAIAQINGPVTMNYSSDKKSSSNIVVLNTTYGKHSPAYVNGDVHFD